MTTVTTEEEKEAAEVDAIRLTPRWVPAEPTGVEAPYNVGVNAILPPYHLIFPGRYYTGLLPAGNPFWLMVRSSEDPERSPRSKAKGGRKDKTPHLTIKKRDVDRIALEIREHLIANKYPRTLNRISIELWDLSANITANTKVIEALERLVDEGIVAYGIFAAPGSDAKERSAYFQINNFPVPSRGELLELVPKGAAPCGGPPDDMWPTQLPDRPLKVRLEASQGNVSRTLEESIHLWSTHNDLSVERNAPFKRGDTVTKPRSKDRGRVVYFLRAGKKDRAFVKWTDPEGKKYEQFFDVAKLELVPPAPKSPTKVRTITGVDAKKIKTLDGMMAQLAAKGWAQDRLAAARVYLAGVLEEAPAADAEMDPADYVVTETAKPKYYKTEKEAEVRLASAKTEFAPGTVVMGAGDHRYQVKNWYRAHPAQGRYTASVLATSLDPGLSGDVWLNVNTITSGPETKATGDGADAEMDVPTPFELVEMRKAGKTPAAERVSPPTEILGSTSTIIVPTSDGLEEVPVQYALVDQAWLKPSHNAFTFQPTDGYDPTLQERDYLNDDGEQLKVIRNAQRFNARLVVNSNPDAVNGPPIVDADGIVLGGNSRVMSIQRILKEDPARYDKPLLELLRSHCESIGLAEVTAAEIKGRILVRIVTGTYDRDTISTLLNRSLTQTIGQDAGAVSLGAQIPSDLLVLLGREMENAGSLREAIRSNEAAVVSALRRGDVITPQNQSSWLNARSGGGLSKSGRDRLESGLVGALVGDKEVLSLVGGRLLSTLERLAPVVLAIHQLDPDNSHGYDLLPALRVAVSGLTPVQNASEQSFNTHWGNLSIFAEAEPAVLDDQHVLPAIILRWLFDNGRRPAQAARAVLAYYRGIPDQFKPLGSLFPMSPEALAASDSNPQSLRIRTLGVPSDDAVQEIGARSYLSGTPVGSEPTTGTLF